MPTFAKTSSSVLWISILFTVAGCSTMSVPPLSSTPPAAALHLPSQLSITLEVPPGARMGEIGPYSVDFIAPAGTYLPIGEDKHGYYYKAPEEVRSEGFLSNKSADGGILWMRGRKRPEHLYMRMPLGPITVPSSLIGHSVEIQLRPGMRARQSNGNDTGRGGWDEETTAPSTR